MGRGEDRPLMEVEIAGQRLNALIDTGAAVTLLSWKAFLKVKDRPKLTTAKVKLRTVSGEALPVVGEAILPLVIGEKKIARPFLIVREIFVVDKSYKINSKPSLTT